MPGPNVLFLFSDEHRRDAMGCAGHSLVKTPNLDRLAEKGTRFRNAYTPSPVCVPARAAMATGRYVHKTRCWSNSQAYAGEPESWGHVLQRAGHLVESIGKLHYRSAETNNGFAQEHLPLYIKNGKGWIKGLLRNHESVLDCSSYAAEIGPGNSSYTDYDLGVTQQACDWLSNTQNTNRDKPWSLFVSWLRPHYPLTCPEEFYSLYPLDNMDLPRFTREPDLPRNPVVEIIKKNFDYDKHFSDQTRQIARASYYGLCSFLDFQIGKVLEALQASGQLDNTIIIYSSDHGDHNGDRGMWTKMSLYDESAGTPLIITGPGIAKNNEVDTLASLVDIYPTMMTAAGLNSDESLPGIALQELSSSADFDRPVLSEYHDGGSPTGMFMLRTARWKYNFYPGYAAELYDMQNDADELINLAEDSNHATTLKNCHNELCKLVDPYKANELAFSDQAEMIKKLGGVDAILSSEEFDFTPIGS